MTRSTEFSSTVKRGMRAAQPDLVIHAVRASHAPSPSDAADVGDGPRVGLVVGKSVGSAVQRHRVARRLRHIARDLVVDLDPADRVVIRALPGSRDADSSRLAAELRAGLVKVGLLDGGRR